MSEYDEIRMTNDELEQALAGLTPAAPEIDRDALMYQAGYAAARGLTTPRRTVRFWQGSTALMTAASVALAVALWERPTPEPVPQLVEAPAVAPSIEAVAASEPPAPETNAAPLIQPASLPVIDPLLLADPTKNYLALRAVVLRRGVDAWPVERGMSPAGPPRSSPSRPSTVRGLMEEFLPPPPEAKRSTNDSLNEASTHPEETVV